MTTPLSACACREKLMPAMNMKKINIHWMDACGYAAMELFLVEKPPVATVEKLWLSASNQSMPAMYSSTAIGSVIMQWAVNVLGSTAVAAVTAAGKTQGLLTVPMESVGTAMATYAGQNLGASRMDRVRQGVNSAMLIILIYGVASAFVLHFTDVQIMSLFLDTAKEVDIVAMGREYLFWNSVFFVPLGALIIWRYTIQGLGFSSLAMLAGVAEMVARTEVAIVLVPVLGYLDRKSVV